jgi:hypothetical protein
VTASITANFSVCPHKGHLFASGQITGLVHQDGISIGGGCKLAFISRFAATTGNSKHKDGAHGIRNSLFILMTLHCYFDIVFGPFGEDRKYARIDLPAVNRDLPDTLGLTLGVDYLDVVDRSPEFAPDSESSPVGRYARVNQQPVIIGPYPQDILCDRIIAPRAVPVSQLFLASPGRKASLPAIICE